jgi:hypothetical protein
MLCVKYLEQRLGKLIFGFWVTGQWESRKWPDFDGFEFPTKT